MFKKILIVLFIVLVLASGALAFFIATFDANAYKPTIEKQLSDAVGNQVSLGRISLGWKGGIALNIQELVIYENNQTAFELIEADAILKILPLIKQSVEVGAISIVEPKVTLIRTETGEVKVAGINPKIPTEPQKKSSGAEAVAIPFLVDTIKLDDAEILFIDETIQPRAEIKITQLSVELHNVSLIKPTDMKGELALFSGSPNIFLKTKIYPPRPGKAPALRNLNLRAELDSVRLGELVKSYPPARQWGLVNRLGGTLEVDTDEVILSETPLDTLEAYVKFNKGYVEHTSVADPIRDILLKAQLIQKQATIESFKANWAESELDVAAKVFNIDSAPSGNVDGTLKNFNLEKLATKLPPSDPRLQGILNAEIKGQVDGFDETSLLTTLTGQGNINIKGPVLVNINIINEVLGKLSMIPGLKQKLESRLSEEYKAKLKTKNTPFEDIDLNVTAVKGVLQFKEIKLESEAFNLRGDANVALSGSVNSRLMLSMDKEISDAMARSVEELRYLMDREGRLELPIQIQGQAPRILVLPDLGYVTSKLAASKVQDLIGGFLDKQRGSGTTQPAPGENQAPATETSNTSQVTEDNSSQNQTPEDPLANLLGGLLQQAIEKNK